MRRREALRGLGSGVLAATIGVPAIAAPSMMTKPIPSTGEALPVIGLGTFQVFDVGDDAAARAPLREVVATFVDAGGRIIDSSPMYGRAEGVTGDLVGELGLRDRVFLATKVWTSGRERGIEQMRRSAELLKSPVIDLMQIHNLSDWRTQLATLREMKARGAIRYLGITHYTTGAFAELARLLETEPGIDFVQFPYSLAVRDAEARLLPTAAARGVATIANRPFEQGDLFRRVRGKAVPDWAVEFDCTSWAQLFLKYLVGDPALTCAIPATNKRGHMVDNAKAGFGRLPDAAQRARIRRLWESL